jgi:allantoate deiminase
VTTVGRVHVEPNLPVAVADRVVFTVDSRHPDPHMLVDQHARQETLMRAIAERRGLELSWTIPLDLPPCLCDPAVVTALERAAQEQGIPARRMHSGAGHDTQNLARIARVAMVFARSKDGRSHTPAEFTSAEDAASATAVLAAAPARLAPRLAVRDVRVTSAGAPVRPIVALWAASAARRRLGAWVRLELAAYRGAGSRR